MVTNKQRAEFSQHALRTYCLAKEGRPDSYDDHNTVIQDLITDLLHAVDLGQTSPGEVLRLAFFHYEAEIQEEQALEKS